MTEVLDLYESVTLEQMKSVRLMNRIDTKFIITLPVLAKLLSLAKHEYFVQRDHLTCIMPYYTLYFDTPDCDMYLEHLRGRKRRQKIRIRRYESSGLAFLEVKNKNNKGRTSKKRIECRQLGDSDSLQFITQHSLYPVQSLSKRLENRFNRITLVNKQFTERLTIDISLRFHNFHTGEIRQLDDFAIVELKRDGNVHSPILEILRLLRVQPAKFSKYCMGVAFTDEHLRKNRFKERMRLVSKMCNVSTLQSFD